MSEPELYFEQIAVGQMANFAYLIGSRSTREAVIVDPAWAVDALLDQAESDGMKVVGALVTHYHQDHIGGSIFGMDIEGVDRLLARQPMPIYVNDHETKGTKHVTGASESDLARKRGGDAIELGGVRVRFLHTPGHTPGSQCFLVDGNLISGDTLFIGSCGRTDLPGSDPAQLYDSLNTLRKLPDDTVLYPGHNYADRPTSTIGNEKRRNLCMRFDSLEEFLGFVGR